MISSLQAASESGLRFVVLDRPNPLGGRLVAGPSRGEDVVPAFLTLAPGPLVHGLTAGEMARLAVRALQLDVRLEVVPLEGWRREMTWADTGRPWPRPSPNLRTAEAALAYPGVALLEATNVSEGRGTDAPFLLLGAPWLGRRGPGSSTRRSGLCVLHHELRAAFARLGADSEVRGRTLSRDPSAGRRRDEGETVLVGTAAAARVVPAPRFRGRHHSARSLAGDVTRQQGPRGWSRGRRM